MAAMAASSIWKGILARTGGGKAILPARAQGIPATAVSPQRLLQRAPSRRSVLGARAPLVDERDDDQASATRARGGLLQNFLAWRRQPTARCTCPQLHR